MHSRSVTTLLAGVLSCGIAGCESEACKRDKKAAVESFATIGDSLREAGVGAADLNKAIATSDPQMQRIPTEYYECATIALRASEGIAEGEFAAANEERARLKGRCMHEVLFPPRAVDALNRGNEAAERAAASCSASAR